MPMFSFLKLKSKHAKRKDGTDYDTYRNLSAKPTTVMEPPFSMELETFDDRSGRAQRDILLDSANHMPVSQSIDSFYRTSHEADIMDHREIEPRHLVHPGGNPHVMTSRSLSPIPSVMREGETDDAANRHQELLRKRRLQNQKPSQNDHPEPIKLEYPDREQVSNYRINQEPMWNTGQGSHNLDNMATWTDHIPVSRSFTNGHPNTERIRWGENHAMHDTRIVEPIFLERGSWERDHVEPEPDIYQYIVPIGMNVIFEDEQGDEITRVGHNERGKFSKESKRAIPIIVQDQLGNELYRTKNLAREDMNGDLSNEYVSRYPGRQGSHRQHYPLPSGHGSSSRHAFGTTKLILIDEQGQQIPIGTFRGEVSSAQFHWPPPNKTQNKEEVF